MPPAPITAAAARASSVLAGAGVATSASAALRGQALTLCPAASAAAALSPSRRNSGGPGASSSFTDAASSYLTSLRVRAAVALTSSLSESDQRALLRSIGVNGESASEAAEAAQAKAAAASAERSVGEAVAAAVRKEAERSEALWSRERERISKDAEAAAMERVKHDLLIQERRLRLEQWKKEVEAERAEEENRKKQEANKASSGSEKLNEEKDVHPILGPVLVDLGYKRVHLASARALAAIPIWEKQRVYRHDRAKVMASDKAKSEALGLPGIISLHERNDGRLAILDGQHRVGMMAILQERRKMRRKGAKGAENDTADDEANDEEDTDCLDLERVLVEVFPQPPSGLPSHARDIFTEINKAEPVKLVDMPGVAKKSERNIIDDAAQRLMDAHPDMFKPSQRCRTPHLNVDNLRDALFAADILKRHDIRSSKALLDWMAEKNQELAHRYKDGEGGGSGETVKEVSKTALAKAVKNEFYLGLDSSWLYH